MIGDNNCARGKFKRALDLKSNHTIDPIIQFRVVSKKHIPESDHSGQLQISILFLNTQNFQPSKFQYIEKFTKTKSHYSTYQAISTHAYPQKFYISINNFISYILKTFY